jgi:hypothetical protein
MAAGAESHLGSSPGFPARRAALKRARPPYKVQAAFTSPSPPLRHPPLARRRRPGARAARSACARAPRPGPGPAPRDRRSGAPPLRWRARGGMSRKKKKGGGGGGGGAGPHGGAAQHGGGGAAPRGSVAAASASASASAPAAPTAAPPRAPMTAPASSASAAPPPPRPGPQEFELTGPARRSSGGGAARAARAALRNLLVLALAVGGLIALTRWREAQEVDPVSAAVDHLNDTLKAKLVGAGGWRGGRLGDRALGCVHGGSGLAAAGQPSLRSRLTRPTRPAPPCRMCRCQISPRSTSLTPGRPSTSLSSASWWAGRSGGGAGVEGRGFPQPGLGGAQSRHRAEPAGALTAPAAPTTQNISLPDTDALPDIVSSVIRARTPAPPAPPAPPPHPLPPTPLPPIDQNISLPDIDALPDLVDSVILGLNVSNAINAISAPFAAGAPGALRPGQLAAKRGLRAKHPVVIIPGARGGSAGREQGGAGRLGGRGGLQSDGRASRCQPCTRVTRARARRRLCHQRPRAVGGPALRGGVLPPVAVGRRQLQHGALAALRQGLLVRRAACAPAAVQTTCRGLSLPH